MDPQNYVPLVEVTRGPAVESVHYGAAAVVDPSGRLLASVGSPDAVSFLRSSSKPFQALPFVESGGAERFGLDDREVAVLCSSHSGTDEHAAVIAGIQAKAGLSEGMLQCGVHPPLDRQTRQQLIRRGEEPSPLRHNCSGKHTGMLAFAIMNGWTLEDYLDPGHPVQQAALKAFSDMCGVPVERIPLAVDGCSAPVFAAPLRNAALAFARLADPSALAPARLVACRRIFSAMSAHPFLVAGPGRFDTALMQAGRGRIVSKMGAEGYACVGLLSGQLGEDSPALGIAVKISDGDHRFRDSDPEDRARPAVMVEILRQLGALDNVQLEELSGFASQVVRNWRQLEVGRLRPAFRLDRIS
jgi:L-asparaginase II